MHRVLTIQEVIRLIFGLLPQKSNATNARVCKVWSTAALDCLWKDIDDISDVLLSLGNGWERTAGDEWNLCRSLAQTDWDPFLGNCRRVHSLSCVNIKRTISPTSLYEIVSSKPNVVLFPNLRLFRVKWNSVFLAPLFLSTTIKTLTLFFDFEDNDALAGRDTLAKANQISQSSPGISVVNMRDKNNRSFVAMGLVARHLASALPSLTTLNIPSPCVTQELIVVSSRLQSLRVLGNTDCPSRVNVGPSSPILDTGAFPSLKFLHFVARIPGARALVMDPQFPSDQLNTFDLNIDATDYSSGRLHGLAQELSTRCSALTTVRLSIPLKTESAPTFRFADITPVLQLNDLLTLSLHAPSAIEITDHNIKELAACFPKLKRLHLTRRAARPYAGLTLQSMIALAEHCPNLYHLEFCINAETEIPTSSQAVILPNLAKLHLGNSSISNANVKPVARFLSRTLTESCLFAVCNDSLKDTVTKRAPEIMLTSLQLWWYDVQDTVSLLIEERTQIRREMELSMQEKMTEMQASLQGRISELEQEAARLRNIEYPGE